MNQQKSLFIFRISLLPVLFSLLVMGSLQSQGGQSDILPRAQRDRGLKLLEFINLGEVIAVQKFKGVIRIAAPEKGLLRHKNTKQIKEYFRNTRPELVIVNPARKDVGKFLTNRVVVEWDLRPRKLKAITLYGIFQLHREFYSSYISLGYQAGFYIKKSSYIPPVRYNPRPIKPLLIIRHYKDKKLMAYIPASFLVFGQGHNPSADNFNPYYYQRSTEIVKKLAPFYMDKYEVTNYEYWRFCQKSGHKLPPAWLKNQGRFKNGQDDLPFSMASYTDAQAYANWAGKRLPTEFEWELAARGSLNQLANASGPESIKRNPRTFPTGNIFSSLRCNTLESKLHKPLPVSRTEDESPFGIFGMCGNIREWTSSWYNPYPGTQFHKNAALGGKQFKVIRGGSYYQKSQYARSDNRDYGGFPSLRRDRSAGFRLVITVH